MELHNKKPLSDVQNEKQKKEVREKTLKKVPEIETAVITNEEYVVDVDFRLTKIEMGLN